MNTVALNNPTASHGRLRKVFLRLLFDPLTTIPLGDAQQTRVRDVPAAVDKQNPLAQTVKSRGAGCRVV